MGNILLLGSGTQALSIVKNLAKAGYNICMFFEEANYADMSCYVNKRFVSKESPQSEKYLENVERIIAEECIDVLIPTGDESAVFLSRNKKQLSTLVKFTIPDYDIFLKGYDKNKLMTLCKEKGYPHPQTIDLSQIKNLSDEELKSFPYPAMLKPNRTTGGRGMVRVNNHQELLDIYPNLHREYGNYHLQRFIREGGRQVKIQLCVDVKGGMIANSALQKVRWFPVKAGSSCCCISMEEEKATGICLQILRDIHWVGFADFDLIEDPDTKELLVMEINPRLPACLGAAVHAGLNWGQVIVDQAMGLTPRNYEYKTGIVLRHLGLDMLWFLKSPQRFISKPSWFHFFGKNVFYQDMDGCDDMKPFFSGTFHNIKKLFDPSIKKQKISLLIGKKHDNNCSPYGFQEGIRL